MGTGTVTEKKGTGTKKKLDQDRLQTLGPKMTGTGTGPSPGTGPGPKTFSAAHMV